MTEFLASAWWLIVALGILVTFHELGHYLAARWCGVKVLRFSVGFGKPIWMRTDRHGTEWAVAPIPLGGYVRMLGEHELADRVGEVTEAERSQAHGSKTVGQRMLIAVAGPLANFVLCIGLLWLMFVIGRPDYAPTLGQVGGVAAQAGLRPGDTLVSVGDRLTPTWTEASMALVTSALDRAPTPVVVRGADGAESTRRMDFSRLPPVATCRPPSARSASCRATRTSRRRSSAKSRRKAPATARSSPATASSRSTARRSRTGPTSRRWSPKRGPRAARGSRSSARVGAASSPWCRARTRRPPGQWRLGVTPAEPRKDVVLRYGPLQAVPAALRETKFQTGELFAMIQRAFSGRMEAKDTVSGPIGIARAANAYARNGLAWYLSLLALLSLSLAVLNLLPVPVLDGGQLLYYLIELVKGSPLSERAMAAGQYVGLALILGLMGLAFYNDLQGLIR